MRVTNDMRDFIVKEAVTSALKKRRNSLKTEENNLALLVYNTLYPSEIQHQMGKLPDEFFRQQSSLYVQATSSTRSSDFIELVLSSSKKVSARDQDWKSPRWDITEIDNAVTRRIRVLEKKRLKLYQDENNLKDNIRAMLKGINTLKQLREEWPEGEAYYKAFIPSAPVKNLPAVRGADISLMILEIGETDL